MAATTRQHIVDRRQRVVERITLGRFLALRQMDSLDPQPVGVTVYRRQGMKI